MSQSGLFNDRNFSMNQELVGENSGKSIKFFGIKRFRCMALTSFRDYLYKQLHIEVIAISDHALKSDNKIINQNTRLYAGKYLRAGEIFRPFLSIATVVSKIFF